MNPSTQAMHTAANANKFTTTDSMNLTDLIIGITTSSTIRRTSFQQQQQQQSSNQQQKQQQKLGPLDVVCGRGRVAQTLAGNQRFQKVIDQHLEQYVTFQTKQDKSNLIRYVAQVCCEEIGFQFLKKQSGQSRKQKGSSSSSSSLAAKKMSNDYIKLDEQEIVNKIGHSFRDAALKLKKGNSSNSSISSTAKKEQKQKQNEQSTELCYYVDCSSDNDENDDETSVITSSTTFSESSSIDSQHSWMYETVIEPEPLLPKRISEPILDNFAEQYLLNLCAQQENGDDVDDCSMEPMSIFY